VKWSEALLSIVVAVATIAVIVGLSIVVFLNPVWVGFEQDRSGAEKSTGFSPDQTHEVTNGVLSDLIIGPPASWLWPHVRPAESPLPRHLRPSRACKSELHPGIVPKL
jgi:hypothetical protein